MTHSYRPLAIISITLPILLAVGYFWLDRPVALYCQALPQNVVQIFQGITKLGVSTGYLIVFALLFVFYKFYRRRKVQANRALFLFAGIAVSGIAVNLIKVLAGRLRPKLLFEADIYGFAPLSIGYEYNSFPSGHAATVFALAWALAFLFPRLRFALFTSAALIGLSRLIVGAHFLSDVVAGAYVGVITVVLLSGFAGRRNLPLYDDASRNGRHV